MSTHTPGSWLVGKQYVWHGHGFLPIGLTHPQANGGIVQQIAAVCPSDDQRSRVKWSDEDRANAHLIAAAPDLLAALKAIVDPDNEAIVYFVPSDAFAQELLSSAVAAIAKAEGRS